jgi:uncharacterized surface protein with fasciclin (FAS1) repeats
MFSLRTGRIAAAAIIGLAAAEAGAQGAAQTTSSAKDIVTIASEAGSFNTLVTAVKAAGLVETLQGAGPFTVFAPNDAAFAKLPPGTLEGLLKDKAQLTAVLTYHVVPGRIMAADVVKAGMAKPTTVNGKSLNIEVRNGQVFVDGARVVSTDITAKNGVIHVLDAVVLPK